MVPGCSGGVQAIIQQKLGLVIPYLPCFNHCLYLVVVDCIPFVAGPTKYFDHSKTLNKFLRQPKGPAFYSEIYLHRLMKHSWSRHLKTTLSIVKDYRHCEICRLLQSIAHKNILCDEEVIVDANGIMKRHFNKIILLQCFACQADIGNNCLHRTKPCKHLIAICQLFSS